MAPDYFIRSRTVERYRAAVEALLGARPDGHSDLMKLSRQGIGYRCEIVDELIRERSGGRVMDGPFAGLSYAAASAGSLISPKLLGTYELELGPAIGRLRDMRTFVDVGCAEGYFAVGATWAFPHLRTRAFDTSARARDLCRAMADRNGVADRITIGDTVTGAELARIAAPGCFMLVDIEGAELELFAETEPAEFRDTHIVIESHLRDGTCTADALIERFSSTHDVELILQCDREPAQIPILQDLPQLERFFAVWEGRGSTPWVWARPRGAV
jgi:hypothetical protein